MIIKVLETIFHHSEDYLRAPGDMVVQHAMFVVMTVNQPTAYLGDHRLRHLQDEFQKSEKETFSFCSQMKD